MVVEVFRVNFGCCLNIAIFMIYFGPAYVRLYCMVMVRDFCIFLPAYISYFGCLTLVKCSQITVSQNKVSSRCYLKTEFLLFYIHIKVHF